MLRARFLSLILLAILVGFSSVANAQLFQRFYLGYGIGASSIDTNVAGTTGAARLDEDDTSQQIFAGLRVTNNLAVEFQLNDFGSATLTGNQGDEFIFGGDTIQVPADNSRAKASVDSYGIALVGSAPVGPFVSLFGKLGVHQWEVDAELTTDGGDANFKQDDTDFFYAGGLQIQPLPLLALRLEAGRYGVDDFNVTTVGGSLLIRF